MKIAMIADLHGNWPATQAMEAALDKIRPDAVWFLGDAVGKGPDNVLTCDWVRAHCSLFLGGNWDYGIGGHEFAGDYYYWDQLGEERLNWLNSLPRETDVWISGVHFRLFHGRPVHDLMNAGDPKEKLAQAFHTDQGDFTGVIFADSHRPFIRTLRDGYMLNTGSVGNSLGVPQVHGLLIEGELDSHASAPLLMSILSLPYDRAEAVRRAEADPNLPHKDAWLREITTGIYSRKGGTP